MGIGNAALKVIGKCCGLANTIHDALRTGKLKNEEKFLKDFQENVPYLNEKNEFEKELSNTIEEGIGKMMKKGILKIGIL